MKRYKHIPTGRIFTRQHIMDRYVYTTEVIKDDNTREKIAVQEWIVTSGKDWEEVGEWTILSFNVSKTGMILSEWEMLDNSARVVYKGYKDWADWHLSRHTIHSVRRENDGEVFTVGDDNIGVGGGVFGKLVKISFMVLAQPSLHIIDNTKQEWSHVLSNCIKSKPKEWEITAFRYNKPTKWLHDFKKGAIISVKPYGENNYQFQKSNGDWDEYGSLEIALKTAFDIYSVKRLSDGVEFKIGDRIKGRWPINKFSITDGVMLVQVGTTATSWADFNQLQKEEKLFTTEDGVDIYEGDETIYITNNFVSSIIFRKHRGGGEHNGKYFATKEAAEEYVVMNNPCLSIKDMVVAYGKPQQTLDRLKEIVKSKLK